MRQIFLPVWGYSRHMSALEHVGGFMWWDELPLCYAHALISPIHWPKPYDFPSGSYIFGDSGGFTLRSPHVGLDPVAVLRWQMSLCTVGAILDRPPVQERYGCLIRRYDEALEETKHYVERALPYYLEAREAGTEFRWWGVMHGNTEEEVEEWYRAIADVYPFDDEGEGWAIKPEPNVNVFTVARSLHTLKEFGITRVHFLAATGQAETALLATLGPEAGLELVTHDSAYAIKQGAYGKAFKPADDGLSWSTVREVGKENNVREFVITECQCGVCEHMRERTEEVGRSLPALLETRFGGWMSTWLQLHNLHVQIGSFERITASASRDLLREVLGATEYDRVARVFANGADRMPEIKGRGGLLTLLD